jgi:signal transduction histidine kinase
MPHGTNAYTLLGLTALVAALVSILVFALLRFMTAARDLRGRPRSQDDLLAGVLEEAIARLKAQERAASARANAFELEEQQQLEENLNAALELAAALAGELGRGLDTIQESCRSMELAALPEPNRVQVARIRTEVDLLRRATVLLDCATLPETGSRVDVRELCERVMLEVRAQARAGGGDATIHGEFGIVDGDGLRLQQALSTMARHALDACSRVPVAPALAISSTLDRAAGIQRLSIDDNCADNRRTQLFRSFPATERGVSPLEVARALKTVLAHRGRVNIKPLAPGGTRVEITLPLPSEGSAARLAPTRGR